MKAMFSLFWQILKFDRGPEDVPYSTKLLTIALLANFVVSVLGQWIGKPDRADMAMVLPVISIGVEAIALLFLLYFKALSNRFVQAASAIFGCDTLLTIVTIPLLVVGLSLPKDSPLLGLLGLLEVILLGWGLGLRAFIYHRALNMGLILANVLALTIFLLTTLITVKAFPELLAQATAAAAEATKSP